MDNEQTVIPLASIPDNLVAIGMKVRTCNGYIGKIIDIETPDIGNELIIIFEWTGFIGPVTKLHPYKSTETRKDACDLIYVVSNCRKLAAYSRTATIAKNGWLL